METNKVFLKIRSNSELHITVWAWPSSSCSTGPWRRLVADWQRYCSGSWQAFFSLNKPLQLCHLRLEGGSVWCPVLCLEDILGYIRYVFFATSLYANNSILLLNEGGVLFLENSFVQRQISCKNPRWFLISPLARCSGVVRESNTSGEIILIHPYLLPLHS